LGIDIITFLPRLFRNRSALFSPTVFHSAIREGYIQFLSGEVRWVIANPSGPPVLFEAIYGGKDSEEESAFRWVL